MNNGRIIDKKTAQDLYKHFFYFVLYNHFHENYSVLYKYASSNTRILVQDLDLYLSEQNYNQYQVNLMLDELTSTTKFDYIFESGFFTCKQIMQDIQKAQQEKNFSLIQRHIHVLNKELNHKDRYLRRLQGCLSSFLLDKYFETSYSNTEKNIDLYMNLLMCFIAELQVKYSRKYIDYLREKNLENNKDFEKAFDVFIHLLFPKNEQYEIGFDLRIYQDFPSEKQTKGFEIFYKFLDQSEIKYSIKDDDNVKHRKIFSVLLTQESDAKDTFIILKNAKIKLLALINSFLFEYNTFRAEVLKTVKIRKIKDYKEREFETLQIDKPEYHVHPKKDSVIEKFLNMSRESIQIEEETVFRIENSLRYYASFLHEPEEDKKLLNLWIAFENLFRNINEKQDTFDKIKLVLCNLSVIYYAREHCDEFQSYILEKGKFTTESKGEEDNKYLSVIKYVGTENSKIFNSIGICKIFCDEKKSEKILQYIKLIKNNYFYEYKYRSLAKIFKRSDSGLNVLLYEELCKKERIISWQIARIYRKRNQIVHGHKLGDLTVEQKDLVMLEYFYHLVIESIVDFICSDNYKTDSILEYIDKLSRSKREYLSMIKKEKDIKAEYIVIPRIFV